MTFRMVAAALAAVGLAGCDEDLQEIRSPEVPFAEGAQHVACVMDGVDFGGQNDQEVTWYSPDSRLLNGGFESKARYWHNNYGGRDVRPCIVTDAHSGRYAIRPDRFPVKSMSLGIRPGRYTLSFWAKNGADGRGGVSIGAATPDRKKGANKRFGTTKEWTRSSFTFDWESTGIIVNLSGAAIVDDIQLSPAGRENPDLVNPFGLELRTSEGEGRTYCDISKPVSVALDLNAPDGAKGTLDIEVTDFFRRTLKTLKDVPFEGPREIPLWERGVFPYRGVFTVRVHVKPSEGADFVDHLRLAVYKFADATAANRFLHQIPGCSPDENHVEYYRQLKSLGVVPRSGDSFNSYPNEWQPDPKHPYYSYTDWAKFPQLATNAIAWGGCACGWVDCRATSYILKTKYGVTKRLMDYETYTPELVDSVEKAVAEMVAMYPQIDVWVSPNEVVGHYKSVMYGHLEDYARLLMAMQRGVRKANPKATFLAYSTCNIGEQGRREIFDTFAAAQRLVPGFKFDAVDPHTYHSFPEVPELDEDVNTLNRMLARIGYDKSFEIWALEGCYYYPFILREWQDIAPWAGTGQKDGFYHFGAPAYSLGWGERIATALMLRDKLVMYKHAPQMRGATAWGIDMRDAQTVMTPFVATAAQTELLGNATFLEDIRFAPNCRAYVFDDHAGHAVAAYWKADQQFDKGRRAGGTVRLAGLDGVEVIDMMGNQVKGEGEGEGVGEGEGEGEGLTLPLDGFPVYLRLPIGRAGEFAAAFNTSETSGMTETPVGFDFKMHDLRNLRIAADNPLTRPFRGTYAFADGKARPLELGSRETKTIDYAFEKPLSFDRINTVAFPMTVKGGGSEVTREYKFNVLPIPYSKGKPDWSKLPLVKLEYRVPDREAHDRGERFGGDEDLSGGFKIAWNEGHLYVRFEIRDDRFALRLIGEHPTHWWSNDAIQMFFDTFGDGPMKAIRGQKGFDGNDMSYDVFPTNETQAVVFRRHVPDHQLTGGVNGGLLGNRIEPDVACDYRFDASSGTRTVELDFPARLLRPMRFEAGSAPGFAVKVMDRDQDKDGNQYRSGIKGWLTNIDPKVGDAFGTMHEYATMLFMK